MGYKNFLPTFPLSPDKERGFRREVKPERKSSYSHLKASIGVIFAAFLAGQTPTITQVPPEKTTATVRAIKLNKAGTLN